MTSEPAGASHYGNAGGSCDDAAMPLMPGAEPFSADGSRLGVLLCHGFTSTPQSLRPWAEHHAAAGLTVRLPLLPGHGTSVEDMARTRWPDWLTVLDRALDELRERCDTVVVGGLSMGGTLALRLAQTRGADVDGLVLVNPALVRPTGRLRALPLLKHVVPTLPGPAGDIAAPGVTEVAYDRVPLHCVASLLDLCARARKELPRVVQPLVVLRSAVDHVLEAGTVDELLAGVSSTEVERVDLPDSLHVATLDHDAPTVHERSLALVQQLDARRVRD